ncbi:MAG: hypothetical protein ACREDR_07905, partial [Blastocatellia bacterium]
IIGAPSRRTRGAGVIRHTRRIKTMGGGQEWGETRKAKMETHVSQFTIVHSDDELCSTWATVRKNAIVTGRPIEAADASVAATAILYGVPLVTLFLPAAAPPRTVEHRSFPFWINLK